MKKDCKGNLVYEQIGEEGEITLLSFADIEEKIEELEGEEPHDKRKKDWKDWRDKINKYMRISNEMIEWKRFKLID